MLKAKAVAAKSKRQNKTEEIAPQS